MAIVVEDGTIVAGAQAYIDTTFTDTYWASRGNPDEWTCLTTGEQEAAILYASLYLETRYRFRGCIQDSTQALAFPRSPFQDREGRVLAGEGVIPEPLKQATAELALRHAISDLFLDKDPEAQKITRKQIDTVSEDVNHTLSITRFLVVDKILAEYVHSDDSSVRIKRG